MLRRCKEVLIDCPLFHGSPIAGMKAIYDYGGIAPQTHGMLPGDYFCVSTNDNMLNCFADGDGPTGFHFAPTQPLRCLHLDWLHFSLLCASESTTDFIPEWLNKYPDEDRLAHDLGYGWRRGDMMITKEQWDEICPEWVEGLIMPWGCEARAWNSEAEIALTETGCARVWQSIESIVVYGEWFTDTKKAWRKIAKLAKLPGFGLEGRADIEKALAASGFAW